MLRDRLLTAAVGLPLLILLVCCAPAWLFGLTVLALTGIGLHEYFTLIGLRTRFSPGAELAWGLAVALSMLAANAALTAAVLVFGLFVIFLLRLPDAQPARSLQSISLSLLGVVYVGFLLPHLLWVRWGPEGGAWVFFLLLVAMGGDTAAYAVGRRWGRRKLMPHVSPGKTVEGSVGAIGGHLCAAGVAWWWLFPQRSAEEIVGVALVAGVLAQAGDLCESAIKRACGAKDSGWLFPGHGGVLDRVDSLLFPGAFLYYYVVLWP
ncbi:MAG: phosphatidate cytidylyltransferase [Thermodesulfobacteriota bacterium]